MAENEETYPRPDDEPFRRTQFLGVERSPVHELIFSPEPENVILATRLTCADFERDIVVDHHENRLWKAEQIAWDLRERRHATLYIYPLNPTQRVNFIDQSGRLISVETPRVGAIPDRERRLEMAQVLQGSCDEIQARAALAKKHQEQMVFSGDVEAYTFTYFTRFGKLRMPTNDYRVILEAGATAETLAPFGEKVEAGFRAYKDIVDGKANVRLANGKEKTFPNIFGMPPNRELLLQAIALYVGPKIKEAAPRKVEQPDPQDEVLDLLDTEDTVNAAILALELFDHWDYDLNSAIARASSGKVVLDRDPFTAEELADLNMETYRDPTKLYIEIRRAMEWGRTKMTGEGLSGRREFPREAGNPMSFGCYPILTAPALDMIGCEMPLSEDQRKQILDQIPQGMRSGVVIPRKAPMTIHDRVFGNQQGEFTTKVSLKVGGITIDAAINYEPVNLRDRSLWDSAQIINVDTDDEVLEFATGATTEAFEVPYKLQLFCVFSGIYREVMRTDYDKLYAEVIATSKLSGMNKKIDIALGLLARGYGLSEDTTNKLSRYVRCVFLGTLAASVVEIGGFSDKQKSRESGNQINQYGTKPVRGDEAETAILEAARVASFLPLDEETGDIKEEYKNLVKTIRKQRRAPLPAECKLGERDFFNQDDLESLAALYPLGLGKR